jgi:hypothetical protein
MSNMVASGVRKAPGMKALKYQYEVILKTLQLQVPVSCPCSIIWKRGPHHLETKKTPSIINQQASFDESLVLNATLFLDPRTNQFEEKKVWPLTYSQSLSKI